MSIPPPKIDRRSYPDIVKQTQELAEQYTDKDCSQPDASLALIRIFSRMATVVSDRLNRVPDRNFMAFLNLIGTQQTPPQPARVPLTFSLAEGSPVDAIVPTRTQISAPPLIGEKEEVIFETEQDLLVTGTKLQAMFVVEDRDYYSDRSDRTIVATSQDEAFLAFRGDRPVEHYLYICCEEIFNLPEVTTASIVINADRPESAIKLKELLHSWVYWDNKKWQPLANVQTQETETQLIVNLTQLPKLMPVEINGQKAKWLRTSLKHYKRDNLPEIAQINASVSINQTHTPKLCLFNTTSLDLSKDFYPFGVTPVRNDTFSIPLADELIKPGVTVSISINLSRPPSYTEDLEVIWEIGNGLEWQIIEKTTSKNKFRWNRSSSPIKFIENSTSATFQFPQTLPELSLIDQTENQYWVRGRITNGFYGTKGRERKYVVYNDVTLVAQNITAGQSEIFADSIDELEIGDIIRLQSSANQIQQEELKVMGKVDAQKMLILETNTRNQYAAGSRILSKFIIAEKTPNIFDPPCVESVTINYKFVHEKPAGYCAYNDFIYCDGTPVLVRLLQAAQPGETIAHLNDVSQFTVGEFVKFDDNNPEKQQIELIDRDRHLVIFTKPLNYPHQGGSRVIRSFHPLTPQLNLNSALYLGFSKAFPNRPNTLYLQVEPPQQEEVASNVNRGQSDINLQRIAWEYASPNGWQPLVVLDETQGLAEKGLIKFIGPTDFIPSPYFGKEFYWLRARKKPNDWENIPFAALYLFKWALGFMQLNLYSLMRYLAVRLAGSADFSVPPRLQTVRTNTTWASQSITLENEVLGSSNNEPKQVYATTQFPIILGEQLEIQEGRMPSDEERQIIEERSGAGSIAPVADETGRLVEVWVRWQEVPDFYSSEPKDRHYVVDRQTGKIYFGDGQAGMIPPRGRNNIRLSKYCTGGGIRGNRVAGTIVELKTTIPYIDSVINWESATGGNDEESLEKLKKRSPQRLRHRDRAVTAQDFEDLVYEASTEIARVKIITPEMMVPDYNPLLEELWLNPDGTPSITNVQLMEQNRIQVFDREIRAGRVLAIVVPQSRDRQPTPNLALLNRVETYLQARFVPTMKLLVSGPKWQEIRVITEIVPVAVESADAVRVATIDRIQSFLHPLTGGDRGLGWSFGRKPHHSDLYSVLENVPGVKYVRALDIQPADAVVDMQTLIYSGQHTVTLKFPGDTD